MVDLLNAHGLCEQCSTTYMRERKVHQKEYKSEDFFTFYNNIRNFTNINSLLQQFADAH